MALIRCLECGKEISDKADACIHCGCPIEKEVKITEYDKQVLENLREELDEYFLIYSARYQSSPIDRAPEKEIPEYFSAFLNKIASDKAYREVVITFFDLLNAEEIYEEWQTIWFWERIVSQIDNERLDEKTYLELWKIMYKMIDVINKNPNRIKDVAWVNLYSFPIKFIFDNCSLQFRQQVILEMGDVRYQLYNSKIDEMVKRNELVNKVRNGESIIKNNILIPKCPTCGSTDVEKISATSKVVGGAMFGIFSSNVRNTMHCKNCGYKW